MIYVASVSGQDAGEEGRLVILRKIRSQTDREIMYSEVCAVERLNRAWDTVGEKIVDDIMAEIREKEEK